jgi:Ca2+-binding RTX toxin-like protein
MLAFLIGCAVILLAVGCLGTRSEAPKEKEQGHTEATNTEQTRSPEPTDSEEDVRCDRTRTFTLECAFQGWIWRGTYTTNDIPGCPKGGLITGTDERDELAGKKGEDKLRGLGGRDELLGGSGSDVLKGGPDADLLYGGNGDDVLYGGPGDDDRRVLAGGKGEDVIYGGDGDDMISATWDKQRDELYCGEGIDRYLADKLDHVSSSCEKKEKVHIVS